MDTGDLKGLREFLKDDVRSRMLPGDNDQARGVPMPPVQKPVPQGQEPVSLPEWRGKVRPQGSLDEIIGSRRSLRKYSDAPLSAEELSYLLWATQGVREVRGDLVMRNVPSAGNRHSVECYVALSRDVSDAAGGVALRQGIWRYLPLSHALLFLGCPDNLADRVSEAVMGRAYVGSAPAVFFWASIPYRTEWRYAEASHKVIAVDVGHVCQNLYLAAESIGCGTCAIASYKQPLADRLLGLDGVDEFVIYLAPLGKNPSR